MNDSITIIKRGRLIKDATTRQVGERTFVEIAIAYNTYGAKAKERYVDSYIVNVTVTGAAADRIAQLKKGDVVTAQGTIEEREYKGKMYKDMPYAEVTVQKAAFLEEQFAQNADAPLAKPGKGTAPVNTAQGDAAAEKLPWE